MALDGSQTCLRSSLTFNTTVYGCSTHKIFLFRENSKFIFSSLVYVSQSLKKYLIVCFALTLTILSTLSVAAKTDMDSLFFPFLFSATGSSFL